MMNLASTWMADPFGTGPKTFQQNHTVRYIRFDHLDNHTAKLESRHAGNYKELSRITRYYLVEFFFGLRFHIVWQVLNAVSWFFDCGWRFWACAIDLSSSIQLICCIYKNITFELRLCFYIFFVNTFTEIQGENNFCRFGGNGIQSNAVRLKV